MNSYIVELGSCEADTKGALYSGDEDTFQICRKEVV